MTSTCERLELVDALQVQPISKQPSSNAPVAWFDEKRTQILASLRKVEDIDIASIVSALSAIGGLAKMIEM